LFPNATIFVESLFGIPKSYVAYRPPDTDSGGSKVKDI